MAVMLDWHSKGQGSDLVLIHGWGMNGAVWQDVIPALAEHFTVHWCDLPGYGNSGEVSAESLVEITQAVLAQAPLQATWLGWSLGGLVAIQAALMAPERVTQLITLASSPSFMAREGWRGIKPDVLINFQSQLASDFTLTVERFLALQAMGSPTARQDIKNLKQAVLERPMPDPTALALGLRLLETVDQRDELSQLTQPWLRMYGRLDGLVPVKTEAVITKLCPQSSSYIFQSASHAPFISHPEEFISVVHQFICKESVGSAELSL
ncbi:pimeloyl-ACP methyl ester esterase BioH [Photobacterium leiognathi]|uniref:pimeloyl-ACP methyl ester esterase BioH n=1 Tax=Photobacterium leiognathi TaxID=553611 RepID=UPI0029819DE7|nr:pimeloyl-ACP methyl ester esterase BioH [Photobacterium leiognathi]